MKAYIQKYIFEHKAKHIFMNMHIEFVANYLCIQNILYMSKPLCLGRGIYKYTYEYICKAHILTTHTFNAHSTIYVCIFNWTQPMRVCTISAKWYIKMKVSLGPNTYNFDIYSGVFSKYLAYTRAHIRFHISSEVCVLLRDMCAALIRERTI